MYTTRATKKLPRTETIYKYEAVYLTDDNELVLQYKIKPTFYNKEYKNIADWCATIPLDKIIEIAVGCEVKDGKVISLKNGLPLTWDFYYLEYHPEDIKNYSKEGKRFLPSSHFSITKQQCPEDIITKSTEIPIQPIALPYAILNPRYNTEPVKFISGDKYSYLVLKEDAENSFKVAKFEHPVLPRQYDEKKIKRLPLAIIADILTFPFQLGFYIACVASDCTF